MEFKEGGEQVVETFGPPSDKHAYAASAAGDTLLSATAEVKGLDKKGRKAAKFNLSHVCPATETPDPSPSVSESTDPSQDPGTDPSPSASESTNPSENPGTDPSPSASESTNPSQDPGTDPSPSASESVPGETASSAAPAPSESSATGDLAETGSSAPVGVLARRGGRPGGRWRVPGDAPPQGAQQH